MAISIKQTTLDNIRDKRTNLSPRFDFIESSIPDSLVYEIDTEGYFIVAPEKSLVPRFVIELKLPRIADFEYYKELSFILNEYSCGIMWFDSADVHAMDFTWRLNLPVKLGPPLFIWDANNNLEKNGNSNIKMEELSNEYSTTAKGMLMSLPFHRGGQTEDAFESLHAQKRIFSLKDKDQNIGVAILSGYGPYTHVSMVLEENQRHIGLGKQFMQLIADDLETKGSKAIIGMPQDSPQTYLGAKSLGMIELKRGMKCMIASSIF